jgi:hypothetical protein
MCCSVRWAKKGLWPGLVGILKMGAAKRLMQINSGRVFFLGGLGLPSIAAVRTCAREFDQAQIVQARLHGDAQVPTLKPTPNSRRRTGTKYGWRRTSLTKSL